MAQRKLSAADLMKEIESGPELKHSEVPQADRSAPVIEPGTAIGESPAPAVFAQLKEPPSELHKVEHTNDRSAPHIEQWPQELKKDPRPNLVSEIKKSPLVEEITDGHRQKIVDDKNVRPALVSEIKSKAKDGEISALTDKAAAVQLAAGDYRSCVRPALVNELKEKQDPGSTAKEKKSEKKPAKGALSSEEQIAKDNLAHEIDICLQLCRDTCSGHSWYDFGLRTCRQIIRASGSRLRSEHPSQSDAQKIVCDTIACILFICF